ncbi:MAG: RtcB family protein [Acidimicrobiales bacterium]
MADRAWLSGRAKSLVDEHPDAYKDIHQVMADQSDLVEIRDRLHAVVNYKGT